MWLLSMEAADQLALRNSLRNGTYVVANSIRPSEAPTPSMQFTATLIESAVF